ncbi:MAG: DUF3343 domain-containing protein [Candidatus Eremiobacteraeota bacterium]|nr:DUF3343 domain-containing protein [Candidatus Eremiobacteraeota bacterium]
MDEEKCLVTFRSIHQVIKAESLLAGQGIWCDMIPNPRSIVTDCGMSLIFFCRDQEAAYRALAGGTVSPAAAYRKQGDSYSLIPEGAQDGNDDTPH